MSLVAYDSSDESEEEIVSSPLSKTTLPKTVSDSTAKRQRECVKITIPSLKEFEDDEHYVAPKKPKLQSGSGLFSLLPPPKNALSKPGFIPYVLSSKKETLLPVPKNCETKLTKTEMFKTLASDVFEEQHYDDEVYSNEKSLEDNSNAATNKDFFSLDDLSSKNKLDEKNALSFGYLNTDNSLAVLQSSSFTKSTPSSVQLPVISSSGMQQSFFGDSLVNSSFQQNHLPSSVATDKEHSIDQQSTSYTNYSADTMTGFNSKESLLKDKEFLKLQGRRHESEALNIIDVKADDQLTDRNEWLMKSLTEESTHRPSRKKHNMPTQQQKRKHQITYLAFQAKEREMDLKNQWALNSRTRRETQAKYGF